MWAYCIAMLSLVLDLSLGLVLGLVAVAFHALESDLHRMVYSMLGRHWALLPGYCINAGSRSESKAIKLTLMKLFHVSNYQDGSTNRAHHQPAPQQRPGASRRRPPASNGRGGGRNRGDRPSDRGRGNTDPNAAISGPGGSPRRLFACPFFLHDMERYQCQGFRRIADVRQHIDRKHTQPAHCTICGITEAECETDLDEHVREGICVSGSDHREHPGITLDQIQELKDRTHDHDLTLEERWFQIWQIIFPGVPQPESPYLSGSAEAMRTRYRIQRFIQAHAWDIVHEMLPPNFPGARPELYELSRYNVGLAFHRYLEWNEEQGGRLPDRYSHTTGRGFPSITNVTAYINSVHNAPSPHGISLDILADDALGSSSLALDPVTHQTLIEHPIPLQSFTPSIYSDLSPIQADGLFAVHVAHLETQEQLWDEHFIPETFASRDHSSIPD